MSFKVHRLEVSEDAAQGLLESFLNQLKGDAVAVVPMTVPTFQGMGGTAKVGFLLIVERQGA